jgi:hypothetical protein
VRVATGAATRASFEDAIRYDPQAAPVGAARSEAKPSEVGEAGEAMENPFDLIWVALFTLATLVLPIVLGLFAVMVDRK